MPKNEQTTGENGSFPIVGIGASAGGLEALELFFTHMAPDKGMAFVVIQHLDPKRKSIMADLLAKRTDMEVLVAQDGLKIKQNTVYLNPPNKSVNLISRTLQLVDPVKTDGTYLPIDIFFNSLADDLAEKAICIVLSGTGTDGTLGLRAIKGAGGLCLVQDTEQAKYDGMPGSAINTNMVDYIMPADKMPEQLSGYIKHPFIVGSTKYKIPEHQFQNEISKIIGLIRTSTGHDFSRYKHNTTRRRIERRMAVHQLEQIKDYVHFLQEKPTEIQTLFKDLLIGVTNFFRDPDAFEIIAEKVLPALLLGKQANSSIRIWIPGCSTGEEAYSLAILLTELLEKEKNHFNVQVFATDLDPDAIDFARTGVYPASIAADITPERLNRFFVKEDNTFKVKKQIREMAVFSIQNVIKDPPFSKLDLISCRNLLIYMNSELQKKLLPLFHYSLNENGFLFLGSSESIGEYIAQFQPINTKWKIFKRERAVMEKSILPREMPFVDTHIPTVKLGEARLLDENAVRILAERLVLSDYAPPSVLINEKYEILYFMGHTDKYLAPPPGEPVFNILKMAREGLQYKLSAALHKAINQKQTITESGVQIKQNDSFNTIDLVIRPLVDAKLPAGLLIVLFNDKTPPQAPVQTEEKSGSQDGVDPRISNLELELQSTREYLQTTVEELETSNEELKSSNEELQSVNEELQSTNEELETSKEELQSTNEELVTVNTELQHKVDELSQANNDINNLLASTDIGTIFLDTNLNIKRFTPAMTEIFNLIKTDIGRPINHITANISYDNLHAEAKSVLDTLNTREIDLQDKEGKWYSIRLAPYRTVDNIIDGVVITFVDVTKIKNADEALHRSQTLLELSQSALKVGSWEWNVAADTLVWSNEMYQIFGLNKENYTPTSTAFTDLIHPDDRGVMNEENFKKNTSKKYYNMEYRVIDQKTGETKEIFIWGENFMNEEREVVRIIGTIQDITEANKIQRALRESEEKHSTLIKSMGTGMLYQDAQCKIISANPAAEEILGQTEAQMKGISCTDPRWRNINENGQTVSEAESPCKRALETGKPITDIIMGFHHAAEEKYRWVVMDVIPQTRPGESRPYQIYTTFNDITKYKLKEEEYQKTIQELKGQKN